MLEFKVLFLCTGNFYRSRFAEIYFNDKARKLGLSWKADSRGLAVERGIDNHGPIAQAALNKLIELKIELNGHTRYPMAAKDVDFTSAQMIIAVKDAEHRRLVRERHTPWEHTVEYWNIHDLDCMSSQEALAELENHLVKLLERLAKK